MEMSSNPSARVYGAISSASSRIQRRACNWGARNHAPTDLRLRLREACRIDGQIAKRGRQHVDSAIIVGRRLD